MQISTKIRYGMRAMVELAARDKSQPVSISVLAKEQNISIKYLENLMVILRNAGLIKSVRGKNGGHILAKNPENITSEEIFEALDGPINLVSCVDDFEKCERKSHCETVDLWRVVSESIKTTLSQITLKDLVDKSKDEKL